MQSKYKHTVFAPVLVIVIFILVFAVKYLPDDVVGMDDNPYLAVVVMQLLTYGIPALFYSRIRGKELKQGLRLKLFRPSQILFLLQAVVFLISGTVLISMLMYRIAPNAFEASSLVESASFAINSRLFDGIYLVVAFGFLPAITEEFVFRGIIIGEYQNDGTWIAGLISAAMFAFIHFSFVRFPVYFFAGLILACVTYTTRSVIAPIIVHAANNIFVLFCEQYVLNVVDKESVSLTLFIIIVGALALVSLMSMLFEANNIYHTYSRNNVETDYIPARRKGRLERGVKAFFSPTFLLLVILFIVACLAK